MWFLVKMLFLMEFHNGRFYVFGLWKKHNESTMFMGLLNSLYGIEKDKVLILETVLFYFILINNSVKLSNKLLSKCKILN